jgi:hypothetical protein
MISLAAPAQLLSGEFTHPQTLGWGGSGKISDQHGYVLSVPSFFPVICSQALRKKRLSCPELAT